MSREKAGGKKLLVTSSAVVTALSASGCVLATPGYDVVLEVRCESPVAVRVGSAPEGEAPGAPMSVDTDSLFESGPEPLDDNSTITSVFPGRTEDVSQLLIQVGGDAGGSAGLRFVVALPVAQESDSEYSFPEGPILIEGDRCPAP